MDVYVIIGSSRLYILATALSILAHRYVLRFNFYSIIYQIRCYIFSNIYIYIYMTFVLHVLPDDGHKRWPEHVGVTYIFDIMQ